MLLGVKGDTEGAGRDAKTLANAVPSERLAGP
jgi:hypothetical protein